MIPIKDDNPTERTAYVTVGIIATCILVFLWELSLGEAQRRLVFALGVIPAVLFDVHDLPPELAIVPPELTVLTSMFLHGDILHIGGNMLYLWIFGNNVEDAMGHLRFVAFYLLCGTAAVLAQALPDPESTTPMIGASGAISGVLGAYLLLYPHARVLVIVPIGFYLMTVAFPASVVLGLWIAFQFISSLLTAGQEGGVAWLAHMGGFAAGLLFIPFFKRRDVRFFQPGR